MIIPLSFQEFDQATPRLYTRARAHTHTHTHFHFCARPRVSVCFECWVMSVNIHHRYSWNRNRM